MDTSFCGFEVIADSPDKYMTNIFVDQMGFVNLDSQIYTAYKVNNKKTISYSNNNITFSNVNKDFLSIQLVLSGSNFTVPSNYELLTDLRDIKHISRKNLPFRKEVYGTGSLSSDDFTFFGKSRQTKFTTINDIGQENREPVIITSVGPSIKNTPLGVR